jgi:hypothetical protein
MLIETEILFTDKTQSVLFGKEVNKHSPFVFELDDVSGIMPGDDENKTSIIFLSGTDLVINLPYDPLVKKYMKAKGQIMQLSHEG